MKQSNVEKILNSTDRKEIELQSMNLHLHPLVRQNLFQRGRDAFNEEQFFEAHEIWEKLWLIERKKPTQNDAIFLQGLIQVAGHFVLLRKKSYSGALTLAQKAFQKLSETEPSVELYHELDLRPLMAGLDYNIKELELIVLEHVGIAITEIPFERFLMPKLF